VRASLSAVTSRYRCTACGNLTRFDVTTTTTTRAYYHYSVGGDLSVEDPQIVTEQVDDVACRWCGHGRAVERYDGDGGLDVLPGESGE
jgi:hypothetical protein